MSSPPLRVIGQQTLPFQMTPSHAQHLEGGRAAYWRMHTCSLGAGDGPLASRMQQESSPAPCRRRAALRWVVRLTSPLAMLRGGGGEHTHTRPSIPILVLAALDAKTQHTCMPGEVRRPSPCALLDEPGASLRRRLRIFASKTAVRNCSLMQHCHGGLPNQRTERVSTFALSGPSAIAGSGHRDAHPGLLSTFDTTTDTLGRCKCETNNVKHFQ